MEEMGSLSAAKAAYRRIAMALLMTTVAAVAAQLVVGIIGGVMESLGVPVLDSEWFLWVSTFVPMYAVAFPVGLAMMKKIPADGQPAVALGGKWLLLCALACFPVMIGGNLIGSFLSALLSGGEASNPVLEYTTGSQLPRILVMVILAPLLEELLFRKAILDRCARYGERTAVFFSALTFALFHMNLFQFFYAFGLGLLFAFVYLRTRRLRYCAGLHMGINFLGSVIAPWASQVLNGLETTDPFAYPTEAWLALGYGLLQVLLVVIGIFVLLINLKKLRFSPAPEQLPKGQRFRTAWLHAPMVIFVLLCVGMFAVALL